MLISSEEILTCLFKDRLLLCCYVAQASLTLGLLVQCSPTLGRRSMPPCLTLTCVVPLFTVSLKVLFTCSQAN